MRSRSSRTTSSSRSSCPRARSMASAAWPAKLASSGNVLVGGLRRGPGGAPTHQHAVQGVAGGQRGDHRRAGDHRHRPRRRLGQVVDQVVPALGHRGGEGGLGWPAAPRRPARAPRSSARVDHLDGELLGVFVVEQHQRQLGLGDLPGPAGHQRQRVGTAYLAEQHGGDLGGGGEPAFPPVRQRVEAGVLDRHAGRGGERHDDLLVVLGELRRALLLGEVEVAEDLVADAHRHAEEAVHRRVVRREAVRVGVLGDVGHPHRAGLVDQQAEHTPPVRQVADLACVAPASMPWVMKSCSSRSGPITPSAP